MKKFAILVATFFVMGWAHGAQTNNGCQGNCPSDGGGSNATATGGNGYGVGIGMGGQGGSGGNGGNGGAGGNASATGQGGQGGIGIGGTGGAVIGSGNSANSNLNSQGQSQGQGQSQSANSDQKQSQSANNKQSQSNSSRNNNHSQASNANSNASQGNTTSTAMNVAGDQVTYQAARIPVATAYASGLTASNGTCMGSVSAGGQGMSFGFSVGTTWKDSGCDRRYNAQALAAVGQAKAAVALLCQDADIRAAMETAGTPCSATKAEAKAVAAQQAESMAVAKSEPTDALIRSRIGLPPLK